MNLYIGIVFHMTFMNLNRSAIGRTTKVFKLAPVAVKSKPLLFCPEFDYKCMPSFWI